MSEPSEQEEVSLDLCKLSLLTSIVLSPPVVILVGGFLPEDFRMQILGWAIFLAFAVPIIALIRSLLPGGRGAKIALIALAISVVAWGLAIGFLMVFVAPWAALYRRGPS